MKTNITKIAIEAGISQGFLSNIICGRRRPHYKIAKKLAAITKTSVELWLEGTENELKSAIKNQLVLKIEEFPQDLLDFENIKQRCQKQ